ncbi:class I SAM-dependent DNA methyltransferase [Arthrobacter bambusae]
MTSKFMTYVDQGDFKNLFIEELGWDQPTAKPMTVEMPDGSFDVVPIAGFHGLHVWACGSLPDRSTQAQIDREVSATSTERLIIFHDGTKQEWRWPRYNKNRGTNMSKLLVHEHTIGSQHSALEQRLEKIALDIDHEITLVQLLERMRTAFDVEESEESSKAAKVMAKLYYELESHLPQAGVEAAGNLHKISVTLARILFLVFADDTMMWDEENLFQNFVAFETSRDGSDLTAKLEQLFDVLNTEEKKRPDVSGHLARFKYVNGGIFSERVQLPDLGSKMRELLLEASRFDWGNISPAIFGSMFQAVKSKELRRELGAHYTSEKDILKTLKPLFLDELHAEFERTKTLTNPTIPLNALRNRLGQIKILDPACGCGNFLIVAYRELRELELQIMEALQDHKGDTGARTLDATLDLQVSLTQIHGIEIDEWPARIAETALHLMDRQCNLRLIEKFGEAPERLPISEAAKIVTATDSDPQAGNALRIDWQQVVAADEHVIVVGNPPFNGRGNRTPSQSAEQKIIWGNEFNINLDYVTCWWLKTVGYFAEVPGRWAFVSTNSVCQGEPVASLWQPILDAGWRCRFAHKSMKWESEAAGKAAVHVSIVGFDKASTNLPRPVLTTYEGGGGGRESVVDNIGPYLTQGPNTLVTKRSLPINAMLPKASFGNMPNDGGHFFLDKNELHAFSKDPVASRFIKRFVGAKELMNDSERWCLWLRDASMEDLSNDLIRAKVEAVRTFRADSKSPSIRTKNESYPPHLFWQVSQPASSYLCIPAHGSEHRPYLPTAYFEADVITGNANFVADDPQGIGLAILSSRIFVDWMKLIGGRIKSDVRFSSTFVYNTFPLPPITDDQRVRLIQAAKEILAARELYPAWSLGDLYSDRMPDELTDAHSKTDEAVESVFGNMAMESLTDRQSVLWRSYLALTQRRESSQHATLELEGL